MVLFLFLSHLAVGIVLTLVFVGREAGVKFFRFNAGLAAILLAFGFAFRPASGDVRFDRVVPILLGVTEAAVVVYWATVGRALAKIRPALVATACISGVAALVLQAFVVLPAEPFSVQALAVASFLTSTVLLGGTCTAMILGHWYLVIPSMQVSLLQSIVKLHIVSTVVRAAVVGAVVFVAIATWQPGLFNFHRYVFSVGGIFFWQRILFGLAGPALLSWMTWETAKIRSTQSATGILYVDFVTVIVGELLAKVVLLATRVPV